MVWYGTGSDPIGLLLCCLTSMVHHSNFLKTTTAHIPGHAFGSIAILHDADLLANLKMLVTTELGGDMAAVTGIPLHIESANLMKKCVDVCNDTLTTVKEMVQKVQEAVKQAVEDQAASNGQVSAAKLNEILAKHTETFSEMFDSKLETFKLSLGGVEEVNEDHEDEEQNTTFQHSDGKLWDARRLSASKTSQIRYSLENVDWWATW